MTCKLLVIKLVRPNSDVPFYNTPEHLKVDMRNYGPPAVVGERNLSNGLVRIRTLLFPAIGDYDNWLTNPVILSNNNLRAEHNKKHGIIESRRAFELDSLDILSNIEI